MTDFSRVQCPCCGSNNKTVKMTDDGKYYVLCLSCGHKTPEFKFVITAQLNWIECTSR